MSLRVRDVTTEAAGVVSLLLVDQQGRDLPRWEPGAHIDLRIPDGSVRQYSLCGDPSDAASWRIAVLREENSRGGSAYLHEQVGTGSLIDVGEPRNNFPLRPGARVRLVAGGIGVTPLLPMVGELAAHGRDWRLYYGGRRRDRMAFLDELARYGDRVRVLPEDEHGLLPIADVVRDLDDGTLLYCCGPEPLLGAVERAFGAGGTGSLHVERFSPREPEPTAGPDRPFEVLLARSGRVVPVRADQSVLDAMALAGLDVPSSCREGTCASCETTVLDGLVDHRDSVLSDEERAAGRTMMLCVSRAVSERVTLDF
jgi:ferredoxin-NADP reductase